MLNLAHLQEAATMPNNPKFLFVNHEYRELDEVGKILQFCQAEDQRTIKLCLLTA